MVGRGPAGGLSSNFVINQAAWAKVMRANGLIAKTTVTRSRTIVGRKRSSRLAPTGVSASQTTPRVESKGLGILRSGNCVRRTPLMGMIRTSRNNQCPSLSATALRDRRARVMPTQNTAARSGTLMRMAWYSLRLYLVNWANGSRD